MRQRFALAICPQLDDEINALRSGNTKAVLENQQLFDAIEQAMMMLGDVPGATLSDRLTKLQGWYLEMQFLCGDLKHKLEVAEAVNRLSTLSPAEQS